MRKSILAGAAALFLSASAAMAADIAPPAPPAPPPAPVPVFTWEGPYRGSFIGYSTLFGGGAFSGTQFGYNFRIGESFIAGIEIESQAPFAAPVVDASVNARFGATVGSADRVLLYSQAGIGVSFFAPVWSVGGGVEVAFRERFSFFAEAKANFLLGGGYDATEFRVGVNVHPGDTNVPNADGNFGWAGMYMGTIVQGTFLAGGGALGEAGVQVGYNFQRGAFVGGFEMQTTHGFGFGPILSALSSARAGITLGASDRVLAYGEVGFGLFTVVPIITGGAGVEFAVGDQFSVFTEAEAVFIPGGGYQGVQVTGGLNIHFGSR